MAEELWVAGSAIPDAESLIRSFCGLPGPDGTAITWDYAYYDARPSAPGDDVTPEDVNAAAAFGFRVTRPVLEGFDRARPHIAAVLRELPSDLPFEDADDNVLETIERLFAGIVTDDESSDLAIPGSDRTIVGAVLHRKRPRLIPLYNRSIVDRYALAHKDKSQGRGVNLLRNMRTDLQDPRNAEALRAIQSRLAVDLDGRPVPSRLRLFDIALWMESRVPP